MSAPSYLLSRVELMVKAPPVPSSFTDTFLVSGGVALDFLLLPAELSGTFSMEEQHPKEVPLPEWVRGVSPVFFPPGAPSAGARALAVDLVGANKSILVVARDRDDTYRAWHLQYVVCIVRSCHELGKCWTAEYPIVRQWKVSNVKGDPLSPEV